MPDKQQWGGEERRSAEREELVKAVVCAVRSEVAGMSLTDAEHQEHHAFIREWVEEVRRKRERREKIRTQVTGWAIVTILGSIGTGAYNLFLFLREHLK